MRKLTTIFGIVLLLPLSTVAEPNSPIKSERELREECSYEIAGMRKCLQKKQENSEIELKLAEEEVSQSLVQWDEDPKYISAAQSKLHTVKKEFIEYRDAQCQFASSLGGGAIGNALDMRRLACITELNNRRAAQLLNAIADLPLK